MQFAVYSEKLLNNVSEFYSVSSSVADLQGELSGISIVKGVDVSSAAEISRMLQAISQSLETHAESIRRYSECLEEAVKMYESTDQKIDGNLGMGTLDSMESAAVPRARHLNSVHGNVEPVWQTGRSHEELLESETLPYPETRFGISRFAGLEQFEEIMPFENRMTMR